MTPIGSTSSNIRRAIEFIACSSCCRPRAPCGHSRSLGRLRAAKLITQRHLTVHLKIAIGAARLGHADPSITLRAFADEADVLSRGGVGAGPARGGSFVRRTPPS